MSTNNNKKYRIVWEKWFDPFGEDDLESVPEMMTSEDIEADFYEDEEEYEALGEENDHLLVDDEIEFYKKPVRVVITPMGVIPYTNNTASNKIFNFWVGHTDFNISPGIVAIIESISGVETLDVFTRYRFRIGVGKLFDAGIVMSSISDALYYHLEKLESQD